MPGTAGSVGTFGLSINGCSHSKKPVWREKTRLTSTEVWAAATSKDWRDSCRASFPPSYLRRQNEALLAGWAFFWLKVPQVPGTAGSAVTFGLSINRCSHSKKPVWHEKTGLTSTEVWAAMTSKDWRDKGRVSFPLSYSRRQNEERGSGSRVPQRGPARGGTWVNFCWVCAAGLSEPLTSYKSILWPIIHPTLVTFGQICNFRDCNSVTFSCFELTHSLDWMKNTLLFICSTNILVRLPTVNLKKCLTPKNSKMCYPILVSLLKMQPHYSPVVKMRPHPAAHPH